MWIGVFDSGLGGLALAQAIRKRLPQYNYLYLGDTKRVPYGGRSQAAIHEFVSDALNFLFRNDCCLVILACNTASAESLRKSQQEYLPRFYPERRILGVIIPTVEAAIEADPAGAIAVLSTAATAVSGAYPREFHRKGSRQSIRVESAPLLVPLIENDGIKYLGPILDDALRPLREQGVTTLILGCTHFSIIKRQIRERTLARVLSQDEIVPEKLADYLQRHPELDAKLGKDSIARYCVTDRSIGYQDVSAKLVGHTLDLEWVTLE
jgi:glutamate racemase